MKTDDNLQALVEAKVEGSRLLVRMLPKQSAQTKNGVRVTIDYSTLSALNVSDGARAELDVAGGASFRAAAKDGRTLTIAEAIAGDFDVVVSDAATGSIAKATSATSQRYKVVDGAQLTVNEASCDRVTVSVADGANMTLRAVNTKRIDVALSDGVHLELAGVAQQQNFSISDGAEVNALRLQGGSANVRAADGSAPKLGAVQTLSARTQDGSSIRYTGEPAATINPRDGSSVRKI